MGYAGISFSQKAVWVTHLYGENARLQPLGLFQQHENRFQLVLKADRDFSAGRQKIKVADTSRIQIIGLHQDDQKAEQDTGEAYYQNRIPLLQGNQWLLKSSVRNGNYYLAYGLSTPLLIPSKLSWSLAYLDGRGHRLWEFHLPETIQVSQIEMLRDGKCLLVGSDQRKNGSRAIMISLWSEYGKELWRKTFGGKGDNEALSACQDLEGHLYVSGYFSADSSFMGNVRDLSGNEKDGFIACYSLSGQERFFSRQRGEGFNSVNFIRPANPGKIMFLAAFRGKDWRLGPFGLPLKGRQDLIAGLLDPLQANDQDSPLVVFPNPATELVYFGLEKSIGRGRAKATLHKKDGSILQSMEIDGRPGSSFRFNVSNTQPGAYFITLKCGTKALTERVLVQ